MLEIHIIIHYYAWRIQKKEVTLIYKANNENRKESCKDQQGEGSQAQNFWCKSEVIWTKSIKLRKNISFHSNNKDKRRDRIPLIYESYQGQNQESTSCSIRDKL